MAKYNVTITYNSDIRGLQTAESELRRLEKMVDQIEADPVNLAGNTPEQLNLLKKQLMDLRVAMAKFKNGAQDAFKDYSADAAAANRIMNKLTAEHRRLTEELKAQARAQDVLNKKEDQRASVLNRTRRALGQSFLEAPLYSASFAIMAGIGAAIQQFVEFDKVLTRIGIVSERSAESMKTFKDMAIETGRALGTTGKAFAEASLIFIQQGGMAADNATSLAEASIKLANITGARAEDTSDYITAIANSFNMLETDGMRAGERIVDMLAELDAATGTSADEIANAFKKSASSFATSGFSPEESAAMLAVISETTRQAPELIGTGMKTLIGNLAEVRIGSKEFEGITNKLQDLTKQFGISFSLIDEYTGDVKDVRTILGEVAEIYSTVNNNAAKNALIEAIAGKEQRDRFIALVENWDRVGEVTDIARKSTGAAQKANERYLDSIGAKIEILKADFEALINELLSSDLFKNLLDQTSILLRNFTTLIQEGNAFANVLERIAAIVVPLASMKLMGGLGGLLGGFMFAPQGERGGSFKESLKGAGLSKGFMDGGYGLLGGGAYASATPGQRERMEQAGGYDKLTKEEQSKIRRRQVGRGIGGGALALGLAVPNIAADVTNQNLTGAEKTLSVIGSLLPAIGALFGPIGMLVGVLGSVALSFVKVNKEAAAVRARLDKMESGMKEAFATSGSEIKELYEVVSQPNVNKQTYEYIEASNKLAQILPSMSAGQDIYGNAILKNTDILRTMIQLEEKRIDIANQRRLLEIGKEMAALEDVQTDAETLETGLVIETDLKGLTKEQRDELEQDQQALVTNALTEIDKITAEVNTKYNISASHADQVRTELEKQYKQATSLDEKKEIADMQKNLETYVKQVAVAYKDVYFTEEELLDKGLKTSEKYKKYVEGNKEAEEQVQAALEKQLDAQQKNATGRLLLEESMSLWVNTSEEFEKYPFALQAISKMVTEGNEEFFGEINKAQDMGEWVKAAELMAGLQSNPDFIAAVQKQAALEATRAQYMESLKDKNTNNYRRFVAASRDERIAIIEKQGFKKEEYQALAEAVFGNFEEMQSIFEKLTDEQKKLAVGGQIDLGEGIINPLEELYSGIEAMGKTAFGAASGITTQMGAITDAVRNSKKPLAEQFQDLLEIQIDFLKIQNWIKTAMSDGNMQLTPEDINNLNSLGLTKLTADLGKVIVSKSQKNNVFNATALETGFGPVDTGLVEGQGLMIKMKPDLIDTSSLTKSDGKEVDLIDQALKQHDLARAKRLREIAEQKELISTLTDNTKEHTAAVTKLSELESNHQREYLEENKDIIADLKALKVSKEDQVRLEQALGKLYEENAGLQDIPSQLKYLEARAQLFEEGTKEYNKNLEGQIVLNEVQKKINNDEIYRLEQLKAQGKATVDDIEKLNALYGEQAALIEKIEGQEAALRQSRARSAAATAAQIASVNDSIRAGDKGAAAQLPGLQKQLNASEYMTQMRTDNKRLAEIDKALAESEKTTNEAQLARRERLKKEREELMENIFLNKQVFNEELVKTYSNELLKLQNRQLDLKEGTKEYTNNLKDQRTETNHSLYTIQQSIKAYENLGRALTPEEQEKYNSLLSDEAKLLSDKVNIEKQIAASRAKAYQDRVSQLEFDISELEAQLDNRIEQSDEYLKVQDLIIDKQRQLYQTNENRLAAIKELLKETNLSEEVKTAYLEEQKSLYLEQLRLKNQINEALKKRAVDEYNIALYGTANIEALQNEHEMRLRLIDDIIDAHEQLIERTQLELEIQKEIEESTDQTYKTNLKYLQNKLKDVKLTKQIIDSTRAQIGLLKILSAENAAGPLRLTRGPSGQFRFAPTAGGEDGRQASMQAAAEFEKESISRYREISDNIFNLEQQIPQMLLRGEDVSRAQSLLGELRTQRNAQAEDVVKSKTISALVAEGKSNIASRLIAGRMTTAQAAQVLSPQQREGIIASAQGEFDSLISSEQLLVQSNFSIVTSNYKLIDALKAFNLKLAAGFNTPEMSQIRGAASGAMPILDYGKGEAKTVRENVENIQKLQDRAFLESELVRTLNVIANRDAAGMNTDAQKRYLDQLNKRLAGTWIQGEWEKKVTAPGFKFETGGYTGDFSGGKLAMLHEKELVLNKMDTKNILDAVSTVRSFMPSISSGFRPMLNKDSINGNQNITINADFPNVSSADEIKKAFASMSTKAMQYAYTTKSY